MDASKRSISMLAPLTIRSVTGAPPAAVRCLAHSVSCCCTGNESGTYACNTSPAETLSSPGRSSVRMKASAVSRMSRYSSMSR